MWFAVFTKDPKLLDFLTFKSLRDFLAFIKTGSLMIIMKLKMILNNMINN
jgi:hypothetical protein